VCDLHHFNPNLGSKNRIKINQKENRNEKENENN